MIPTRDETATPDDDLVTADVPHGEPAVDDWGLLYRANARPLYRYLLRLTLGNREEAEDHLQETFLRAWRWLQQNPADLTTIRPWLFTVARRIVIDAARSRRVRPTEVILDDATPQRETSNDIELFVLAQSVRQALRTLSSDHQAALVELFYHDHTAKEAAGILGIPEGTVKSRAHYALRALRAAGLRDDPTGMGYDTERQRPCAPCAVSPAGPKEALSAPPRSSTRVLG
jgi:RNA polymerase sigma-70 factor, ECF subfamily